MISTTTRAWTSFYAFTVIAVALVTMEVRGDRTMDAIRVEPMRAGRSIDELRDDTVGRRCPASKCLDGPGRGCPEGAAVWSSGTFVDDLTAGALEFGGRTLQLSLCCNYTFRRDFIPSSSSGRSGAPEPTEEQRRHFARFVKTLTSHMPATVQQHTEELFHIEDARVHPNYASLELRTRPVPAATAEKIVASLQIPPAASPGDAPYPHSASEDEEAGQRTDLIDGWVLHVSNSVLDCKCPRTLRAHPIVIGRRDVPPAGLEITNAGLDCRTVGSVEEARHRAPFELLLDVPEDGGLLKDFARVSWTVAPASNPLDGQTVWSRRGVRVFDVPRDTIYTVTVVAYHGRASATFARKFGWAVQSAIAFDPWIQQDRRMVFGARIPVNFTLQLDGLIIDGSRANATCAALGLDEDGSSCLDAWRARVMERVKCNVPFRLADGELTTALMTARAPGEARLMCSAGDPIGACPRGGTRAHVNSVQITGIDSRERVICTNTTTLTAAVEGAPFQPPEAPPLVQVAWTCELPPSAAAGAPAAPTPTPGEHTVTIPVPDTGLVCTFTAKATEAGAAFVVPTAPDHDRVTVSIASSRSELVVPKIDIVNMTTKDLDVKIVAPTGRGRWVGNQYIVFRDPTSSVGVLTQLPLKRALQTFVKWINDVRPCVGHEFFVPIDVKWAAPTSITFCDHRWNNDGCVQLVGSFPKPDEETSMTILNETGTVHPDAYLHTTGVNSVMLCDAPPGSIVKVQYRVFNPAGSLEKTCVVHRCSHIPSPTLPTSIVERKIVVGPKMTVEANADFDEERFFGTWTSNQPSVMFDDPHALKTTARGLVPGKNTIRFTLDALGEESRPGLFCPTRSILFHVMSESAECPASPLRTCSDSVESPFVQLAPPSMRVLANGTSLDTSKFEVTCSDPAVRGTISDEGMLRFAGMQPGTKTTCSITALVSEFAESHCSIVVERVSPIQNVHLVSGRRFWVGDGEVPVTVAFKITGYPQAPPGEQAPRDLSAARLHIRSRSLQRVAAETIITKPIAFSAHRNATASDNASLATLEMIVDAGIGVAADTLSIVTFEIVDDLCGNTNFSHRIFAVRPATVGRIITCDSRIDLVGIGLPRDEDWASELTATWTLPNVTRLSTADSESAVTPYITLPSPYVRNAKGVTAEAAGLPYGYIIARFTVALRDDPSVALAADLNITAASQNLPPHEGYLYTTLSQLEADVAREVKHVFIKPAPGFVPKSSPVMRRDTLSRVWVGQLYRGRYHLAYTPHPVTLPVPQCPDTLMRRQHVTIERLALRVVAGWSRWTSECDLYRGEASVDLYLLAAHPDGSFTRPPAGVQFASNDAKTIRELLLNAQQDSAVARRQHPGRLWWLTDDAVQWNVTAIPVDGHALARRGVHLRNETETEVARRIQIAANHPTPNRGTHLDERHGTAALLSGRHLQAIRITLRSEKFFAPSELDAAPFHTLRVPAETLQGLAESVDPEFKKKTLIRTVSFNDTAFEALKPEGTTKQQVWDDESIAAGAAHLRLALQRPLPSADTSPRPFSGLVRTDDAASGHCRSFDGPRTSEDDHSVLGAWFPASPFAARHIGLACAVDAVRGEIRLRIPRNDTFVIADTVAVPLAASKRVLCGLPDPMRRLPQRRDTIEANSVVDFGTMAITKTPTRVKQARDAVKLCVLSASVAPIDGRLVGGYILAPWLPSGDAITSVGSNASREHSVPRRALEVRRADGRDNEFDRVARGRESVAACIEALQPTLQIFNRKDVRLRVQPCPNLQLGTGADSNITLLFTLPEPAVHDGTDTRRTVGLTFTIMGSRAIITPLMWTGPNILDPATYDPATATPHLIDAVAGHPSASEVADAVTKDGTDLSVVEITEAQLKSGRLVLRITLDADVWHPAVGQRSVQPSGFNTAMANGFGLEEPEYSPAEQQRLQHRRERWFSHLVGLAGLVRYTDTLLKPHHVVRVNDTVVDLLIPGCTGESARRSGCPRIAFSAVGAPLDEPVPYFVPGIATECPNCLRATPALRIVPVLGGLYLEVPSSSATAAIRSYTPLAPFSTLTELPSHIALVSTATPALAFRGSLTDSWAAALQVRLITVDNSVRARYVPAKRINDHAIRFDMVVDMAMNASSSSNGSASVDHAAAGHGNDGRLDEKSEKPQQPLVQSVIAVISVSRYAYDHLERSVKGAEGVGHARYPQLASASVGPITLEVPFAIATSPPPESMAIRVGAAASFGYLAFMAVEAIWLWVGSTSARRQHFGPTSVSGRAAGFLVFAVMLVVPVHSALAAVLFGGSWAICFAVRGFSLLSAELFLCHAVILYFAA